MVRQQLQEKFNSLKDILSNSFTVDYSKADWINKIEELKKTIEEAETLALALEER